MNDPTAMVETQPATIPIFTNDVDPTLSTSVLSKITNVDSRPSGANPIPTTTDVNLESTTIDKGIQLSTTTSASMITHTIPRRSSNDSIAPATSTNALSIATDDDPQLDTSSASSSTDIDEKGTTNQHQPPFSAFPTEVLLQICRYLEHKCLINLCLANRRFHALITPVIYTTFSTSFGHETLFLRTITATPHLANHIRHLRWVDENDTWDEDTATDYEMPNRQMITDKLSRMPSLYHKQIAIACEHAGGGTLHVALLAAAMSLTPNIETLSATLTTSGSSRIRWNETVWLGCPHAFTHLHTIRIKLRRSSSMDLNALFLLPSVRVLDMAHVDRLKSDPPKTIWLPPPPQCSNVEVLIFRESNVETDILVPAVKACKTLRTFLYQHHAKWSSLKDLEMAKLISAVRVHRETLENLAVMDRKDPSEDSEGTGIFDDMLEMPLLSNILLPLSRPHGRDKAAVLKLPAKVTSFAHTVRGDESRKAYEAFLSWCSRSCTHLLQNNPRLKDITCWITEASLEGSLVSYMARQACKKAGIELSVKMLDKSNVSDPVDAWERNIEEV
ncbi:hypothetical protein N0V90_008353 [Kalmusia sp. IMI 367209]|nr:hypothetical protein N0V90_008353 [Kalmusia sp. IMI 367209]